MRTLEFLLILVLLGGLALAGRDDLAQRSALAVARASIASTGKAKAADVAGASRAQVSCASEVAAAVASGAAIARISAPVAPPAPDASQPLIDAADLRSAIQ